MSDNNDYYRPYIDSPEASETESISDSEAGISSSEYESDSSLRNLPNGQRPYAPQALFVPPDRADLYRMGGPSMNSKQQSEFSAQEGAPFDKSGWDSKKPINYGSTTFKTNLQGTDTTILIDSLNRDRVAYPQPTRLQLHLPRVYRNVTSINITQMKLLSAFFTFRNNKYNTNFKVWENGRYLPDGSSNIINVRIREGSYTMGSNDGGLLRELMYQMNVTPTFFFYPNEFNDFASAFAVSGDLGLNFNQPGTYYYDALLQKFYPNPTMDYIVTRYFKSRYISQTTYTLNELQVAYYYPVLFEALLDPAEAFNIILPLDENAYDRLIYNFQGLDDAFALSVIQANVTELERYRTSRTFLYSLVNYYNWSTIPYNKRVTVDSALLNPSIIKDLSNQSNTYLNNALNSINITYSNFITLSNTAAKQNAVLNSMYNFYQSVLASNFAVNYGSYSLPELAGISNYIYTQSGNDVTGVFTSYSAEYIAALEAGTVKPVPDFNYVPSSPTIQWPNMSNIDAPTIDWINFGGPISYVNFRIQDYKFYNVYDRTIRNIDTETELTNAYGILNTTAKYGSAEINVHVSAGQYILFPIRSGSRQTLQVETVSRPYRYRYPDFNGVQYSGFIPTNFAYDYEFGNNAGASTINGMSNTYISTIAYGIDRSNSWTSSTFSTTYTMTITSNYKFFKFRVPQVPSTFSTSAALYDVPLTVELANPYGSSFSTNMALFVYHDEAGYFADARQLRKENPQNYLAKVPVNSNASSVTATLPVILNEDYYAIVRSDDIFLGNTDIRFLTYWNNATSTPRATLKNFDIYQPGETVFSEQYGVLYDDTPSTVNHYFYKTYNTNYNQLPYNSNVIGINPSDPQFDVTYPANAPLMGFDDNGVSDDMTNYIGFTSNQPGIDYNATFRQDPISQYTFMCNSPYNSTTQTYIYNGGSNVLLTPQANFPYTPTFSNVTKRSYSILHNYSKIFFGPHQADDTGYSFVGMSSLSTMLPYTSNTTLNTPIAGYNYIQDIDLNVSTLRLGTGIVGFSFLPTDGVWDAKSVAFKSAYYGVNDPNSNIVYLGIFDTNALTGNTLNTIDITQAYAVLSCTKRVVYNPSTVEANQGFDASYGTYHNFELLPSFNYSRTDLVAQGISGYTPFPSTVLGDPRSMYSVVPFRANFSTTTYFMLCGSAVPFPDDSDAQPTNNYNGTAFNDYEAVIPVNYTVEKDYITNIYQSQYQQSLPITTTTLSYLLDLDIIEDPEAIFAYPPFGSFFGVNNMVLRNADYQEGSNRYLLLGGVQSQQPSICDAYLLRNPGNIVGDRDTVFFSSFNLASYVPSTHQFVTWGANAHAIYIMTRPNLALNSTNIYVLSTFISTSSVTPNLQMTMNMEVYRWDVPGATELITPTFDGSNRGLRVTNRGDWVYYDNAEVNGVSTGIGVIAFNNTGPTNSTFTGFIFNSNAYDPNNIQFPSTNQFYTVNTNVSTNVYGILGKENRITQNDKIWGDLMIMYFSTSTATNTTPDGYICNEIILTSSINTEPLFRAGVAPPPGTFDLTLTTDYNVYTLNSGATNRFNKLILDTQGVSGKGPANIYSDARQQASAAAISSFVTYPNYGMQMDRNDGIWFTFETGPPLSDGQYNFVGNSRQLDDINRGVKRHAMQLFYPNSRIVLNKRLNKYNDITNLVDINYEGSNYFELPKTQLFFYNGWSDLAKDVSTISSGITKWKWGMESNFYRADTGYNGYGFNSYIYNIPLSTSGAIPDYGTGDTQIVSLNGGVDDYYWIALRGYSPNEDYEVMVRFVLPNRHDYGALRPIDMISEISTVNNTNDLLNYNPEYVCTLRQYDVAFNTTRTYGSNSLPGFPGSNITTINYSTFMSSFENIYYPYSTNISTVNYVLNYVNSNVNNYISTYYGPILPSSILNRLSVVDSLQFDLLFSTSVAPQASRRDIDWGLGYNLGFARTDYLSNTSYIAPTFYNIIIDYIYLQINPEQSMNLVDTTGREVLSNSQESTGEVRKYFGKLLLGNFSEFAQNLVGTTAQFNPPIGRLDKMIFNWLDTDGNIIDNNDCEWSCVLQIKEQANIATSESSLPKL